MARHEGPRFGLQEHQVFWAKTGEVACACCPIPYPGSDTWVWDSWQEITPEVMAEIDRSGGSVACYYCGKEPSRFIPGRAPKGERRGEAQSGQR